MEEKLSLGHLAALFTVVNWGTTFIATKLLLEAFTPIEILLFRFVLGFLALWLVCPRRLKVGDWHREAVFAAAGLTGVCLYYLLENIALTFSTASNVGVIVSASPLFAALFTLLLSRGKERPAGASFWALWCPWRGSASSASMAASSPWTPGGTCWRCWPPWFGRSTPCSPSRSAATAGT